MYVCASTGAGGEGANVCLFGFLVRSVGCGWATSSTVCSSATERYWYPPLLAVRMKR